MQLGFILPSNMKGRHQLLPPGWLMVRRCDDVRTLNLESVAEIVDRETGETSDYIYISPNGCRFTSLKVALKYAGKQMHLDQLPQDVHTTFNAPNSTSVEFTCNQAYYMHRGLEGLW